MNNGYINIRKLCFRTRNITRDEQGHFKVSHKRVNSSRRHKNLNTYASDNKTSNYMKQVDKEKTTSITTVSN